MKIACFHKYYSVNFFICLILVTAVLFIKYSVLNPNIKYAPRDDILCNFVIYHLPKIISVNALLILIEHILTKFGIIKKHCNVIKSKYLRIFIYIVTTILFLLFVLFVSALYLFIIFPARTGLLVD